MPFFVVFYSPFCNLLICKLVNLFLKLPQAFNLFFRTSQDVQRRPSKKHGNRVQVRSIYIKAHPCSLKRHTSTAAEAVTYHRDFAESFFAELMYKFLKAFRVCAKMFIYFIPRRRWKVFYFFGSYTVSQFFIVCHPAEGKSLEVFFFFSGNAFFIGNLAVFCFFKISFSFAR